ncbi:MAG: hypothetical protein M3Y27_09880 [Acidobacteriota bacterium]|nr:hypothetical protein [Acidobacteriota bacterium]
MEKRNSRVATAGGKALSDLWHRQQMQSLDFDPSRIAPETLTQSQMERWQILQDTQKKIFQIQSNVTAMQAGKQDKAYKKWDEYIRDAPRIRTPVPRGTGGCRAKTPCDAVSKSVALRHGHAHQPPGTPSPCSRRSLGKVPMKPVAGDRVRGRGNLSRQGKLHELPFD